MRREANQQNREAPIRVYKLEFPPSTPLFTSVAPEPTFWRAEPSRAFTLASRAEPSFPSLKNEPQRAFYIKKLQLPCFLIS